MIGIGITTRNREYVFHKTLQEMKKFLPSGAKLVVVDDNSDKPKHSLKVDEYFYFKQRAGIAKAKNKCIELLEGCDDIFLFDDDFYPTKKGWEKIYIDAKDLTGCQHMCFTFDLGDPDLEPKEFRILNNVEISILSSAEQIKYAIEEADYLEHEAERKKRMEKEQVKSILFKAWKTYFEIEKRIDENQALIDMKYAKIHKEEGLVNPTFKRIEYGQGPLIFKYHKHPNGIMMYISKQCLETIGGFNTDRPIYGGEHAGYSHRAYNAALTPHPYVDVNNSAEYFCGHQITLNTETVLTIEERAVIEDEAGKAFEKELRTFDFYPYKSNIK